MDFTRLQITLSILFYVAVFGSASAKQSKLTAMMMEKGTCKQLVVLRQDLTTSCDGKLINTDYDDGRSGFYFITKDGIAVTFSGNGNAQVKPDPNTAIQPIDIVIFGQKHEPQRAVGFCRFTNPYQGAATIDCVAETAAGHFAGSFATDGSEPNLKKF